jgi:hypothetical protein
MIWAAALGGSGLGVAPDISARAVRHGRDAGGAASASSHPFGWASDESVLAGSLYLHDAAVGPRSLGRRHNDEGCDGALDFPRWLNRGRCRQPRGVDGDRLYSWFSDGDTPSRYYPSFKMSGVSAAFFDEGVGRVGAVIAGRRTYDISKAWCGERTVARRPAEARGESLALTANCQDGVTDRGVSVSVRLTSVREGGRRCLFKPSSGVRLKH